MNSYFVILAFIFLQLLSTLSCTKVVQVPQGQKPQPGIGTQPTANNPTQTAGPGDGGGGDTCQGKLIESYRVEIFKTDSYVQYLNPLLKNLSEKIQSNYPNLIFMMGFNQPNKNWYIVPCALNKLSAAKKGLFLDTDQAALQTESEIYIDQNIFEKMSREEQAKLILHETVMSVYLLKYLYLSEIFLNIDFSAMNLWKMYQPEPRQPLNAKDHQNIRALTHLIWSQNLPDDLKSVFANHQFDKRFIRTHKEDESVLDPPEKEIKISIQKLIQVLKKYNWSKTFPQHCDFDPKTLMSRDTCEINVDFHEKEKEIHGHKMKFFAFEIEILKTKSNQILKYELFHPKMFSEVNFFETSHDLYGFPSAPWSLTEINSTLNMKEGHKVSQLLMTLNLTDMDNIEIFDMKFVREVVYSTEKVIEVRDGSTYQQEWALLAQLKDESVTIFSENQLFVDLPYTGFRKIMILETLVSNPDPNKPTQ